jgi:16S rRNA G966 N2-methylase RsmD
MYITKGVFKKKKILSKKNNQIRLIPSRIKIDIFNIIRNYLDISGKIICFPFSDIGSLVIDFLSRGAKYSYCNNNIFFIYKILQKNIKNLGLENRTAIFKLHYKSFLKRIFLDLLYKNYKINLLFLSLPNKLIFDWKDVINFCLEKKMLSKNVLFVIESNKDLDFSNFKNKIKLLKSKKYSKIQINIFTLV